MIKTGIFGDFGNKLGSSPSSGASPSVIQTPQTEEKTGKKRTKKSEQNTLTKQKSNSSKGLKKNLRKQVKSEKAKKLKEAKLAAHKAEVAKRRAEKHQQTLERRAARKDYQNWWKSQVPTTKSIERAAKREADKRAKAIAKAEEKAYRKWWKEQERAKEKEAKKEARKREKAAREAEEKEFFDEIKEVTENLKKWQKEGKIDVKMIKEALGSIKGLKITPTGKISKKSDIRSPLLKKTLKARGRTFEGFKNALNWSDFSPKKRFQNLRYQFQDLFEYFLDPSELSEFGYDEIAEKIDEAETAFANGDMVDGENLLDELNDLLVAAIDKAKDLVDYEEGLGYKVYQGQFTRTKFANPMSYDVNSDYDDF